MKSLNSLKNTNFDCEAVDISDGNIFSSIIAQMRYPTNTQGGETTIECSLEEYNFAWRVRINNFCWYFIYQRCVLFLYKTRRLDLRYRVVYPYAKIMEILRDAKEPKSAIDILHDKRYTITAKWIPKERFWDEAFKTEKYLKELEGGRYIKSNEDSYLPKYTYESAKYMSFITDFIPRTPNMLQVFLTLVATIAAVITLINR